MSFVLPATSADAPPSPRVGSGVTVETVPARLVAAKEFSGLVTDAEVERQRVALLDAIEADGRVAPVDATAVSVLQYNGPVTLPWRRRNEVALVVTEVTMDAEATEFEAGVGGEATGEAPAAVWPMDGEVAS